MRYLILSDIHANLEALEAVLDAATAEGYDRIVCCGDLVGYGADPNAVTEWVRANVPETVRGNHDRVCVGLDDLDWFSEAAQASARWTQRTLTPENAAYLRDLPKGPRPVDSFQILHGSPLDEDAYLVDVYEARQVDGYLDTPVSFFGHTHLQGGFSFMRRNVGCISKPRPDECTRELTLEPDAFYLINPGSIGQPRDNDYRAAWATYDIEERLIRYRRIPYDFPKTQQKIREAGLPAMLANRLALGR